jgi:hypothetical protein
MRRPKTFTELRSAVLSLGWVFDHRAFDAGSDFVDIFFVDGKTKGHALVSMVDGTFFGELEDGTYFNERSTRHEKTSWFKGLQNVIFTNKPLPLVTST